MSLRSKLIRLSHENPELREHIVPILTAADDVPTFVLDLKKAGIRLTPPVAGALAWTSKKKNDTDVTDALEKAGWKLDHSNLEHGGFRANYKLSKNGVKIEVATLNYTGLGTRVWESLRQAAKAPGFKAKLDVFRKNQEDKALELVEDGRTFFEVSAYLGGIGRNEMKVNYPSVYRALESKGKLAATQTFTLDGSGFYEWDGEGDKVDALHSPEKTWSDFESDYMEVVGPLGMRTLFGTKVKLYKKRFNSGRHERFFAVPVSIKLDPHRV